MGIAPSSIYLPDQLNYAPDKELSSESIRSIQWRKSRQMVSSRTPDPWSRSSSESSGWGRLALHEPVGSYTSDFMEFTIGLEAMV